MAKVDLSHLPVHHIILLNKISSSLIPDFNELSYRIYQNSDKSDVVMFNPVLSRNPYHSGLFLSCCYLEFIKTIIHEENDIDEIIVPDRYLKKIILKYFSKYCQKQIKISVMGSFNTVSYFKDIIRPVYSVLRLAILSLKYLKNKSKTRFNLIPRHIPVILLDLFLLQSNKGTKSFQDRYYTGILDFMEAEQREKIFFLPQIIGSFSSKNLKEIADNSREKIVFIQDFLRPVDYLGGIRKLFKYKRIKNCSYPFREFDLQPLIVNEYIRTQFSQGLFQCLLNFKFFKRLRESNIKIHLFIDWYENQAIDKSSNLGIHTYFPGTPSYGYKGYIISEKYNFYVNPTLYEIDNSLIPDKICVIGKGFMEMGTEDIKIKRSVAPAFRFNKIYQFKHLTDPLHEEPTALVVLPIAPKESFEIIDLLIKTNKKMRESKIKFRFKPHPAFSIEWITSRFQNQWPLNFEIVTGDFNQLLLGSNILLGNTSSSCVEALALGIPVIIIGSQSNLTQNPIPENVKDDIWRLCYTSEEIIDALTFFFRQSKIQCEHFRAIGEEIKLLFFQPVTKKGVRDFLNL